MKRTTASLVLLAALFQIACQSSIQINTILQDAQSRMDSQPDSALFLLRTLDPRILKGRSLRARYALLYSQALDKNYIDLQSDSVIAPAVAYYSGRGCAKDRAYTNYYLGCIYYNAGNIDKAVQAMIAAESHAAETGDNYLLARIYNCLGNMYYDQHSFGDAEIMFSNAETYYCAEKDTVNQAYAIVNKALVYSLTGRSSDAIAEYRRARTLFEYGGDKLKASEMTRDIVNEMRDSDAVAPDSLKRLLCRAYSVAGFDCVPREDYSMWASIYLSENKPDSARYFGVRALNDGSIRENRTCGAILRMCRIEELAGNYRKATDYWHAYYNLFDSITRFEREHLVQEAGKRYRNQELVHANNLLRIRNRYTSVIWGIVFVVCLITIRRIYVGRIRRYRQFIETLNENYDAFKKRYLQLSEELNRNSAEEANLLNVLERQLKRFQHLLDKGYKTSNDQNLIKEFKEYAKSIGEDKSLFADWQFVVDKQYFGLVGHLREIHPKLTDYELDMLCLIQLGFSFNCIRLLFRHDNIYSLYSRRTKLHKKLGLPSGCRLEDYLSALVGQLKENADRIKA